MRKYAVLSAFALLILVACTPTLEYSASEYKAKHCACYDTFVVDRNPTRLDSCLSSVMARYSGRDVGKSDLSDSLQSLLKDSIGSSLSDCRMRAFAKVREQLRDGGAPRGGQ